MDVTDQRYDPLYQKMVAAFHGDTDAWRRTNAGLRDAMVDFAVKHSPYWSERAGGRAFEDIPVLTRSEIREHLDGIVTSGVSPDRRLELSTSGSAGEPLTFYRDLSQGVIEEIAARRFLLRLHAVPDDAVMVWVAASPPPGPNVHTVPTPELTPQRLAEELPRWELLGAHYLYGYASAMEWIADQIEEQGLRVARPPVCVITTGDQLTDHGLEGLERAFGRPIHSWYGSHEFNGFLAGTFPGTRRYAFNPLLAYVEIVDEDGTPVPPGRQGRLLVTDLNNYVQPFIRYDTGDLATAGDQRAGGFPVVESIDGRSAERLLLPSGKALSGVMLGQTLFAANPFASLVRLYQCEQTAENSLELRVVWRGGEPDEATRERIVAAVRSVADPDTSVTVRTVDALEALPSGKRWIVRKGFA